MMKLVKMAMLVAVMVGTGTVVQATQPPSAEYGSKTDYRPDDVKEIDEKVASITREFFVDLENDYGIKLNPKQESLVASRIENVLKGIEIGNLERGLRLVRIPEDQIKSIIAEFQKKIPSFRKYLDQKGQEIMMAYRDTKEEGLKIDKRLREKEAEEINLQKEIAIYKAKVVENEAKVAENEELHMVLQETQMILQRLIQQEEQLKKEKQRGMKRRS